MSSHNKKLLYLFHMRFPSEKANSYQILQMIQGLIENHIEVFLYTPKRKNLSVFEDHKFNLKEYFNLRVTPEVVQVKAPDFLEFKMPKFLWPLLFYVNLLAYSFYLILKIYRHRGADFLYFRDPLFTLIFLQISSLGGKKFFKGEKFLEMHGLSEDHKKRNVLIKACHKVDFVIALTKQMKKELISLGIPDTKIFVEHDGVDLKTFEITESRENARKLLNLDPHCSLLGYVGKFHTMGQEKGISDIIKSSKHVLSANPDAHFFFVGGPLDWVGQYQDQIKSLNLPFEKFHFIDRRSPKELPLWLKSFNILLMPFPNTPHYAKYMSPLKLFEYMSSGTPIIATKLPSIEEILTHEKNSFLCNPDNPVDLADKINSLLLKKIEGENLARIAQEDVQKYSWNKRAQRILKNSKLF